MHLHTIFNMPEYALKKKTLGKTSAWEQKQGCRYQDCKNVELFKISNTNEVHKSQNFGQEEEFT